MMAVALSALKTPMAGLVLTGDFNLDERVWNLCKSGFETGLPVLSVQSNSWETATHLNRMDPEVPEDDLERVQLGMDHVARYIDADWIASPFRHSRGNPDVSRGVLLPPHRARASSPRNASSFPRETSRAPSARRPFARSGISPAASCWEIPRRFSESRRAWKSSFPTNLEILDPALLRANYVDPLVEMRKHKGLTPEDAADLLERQRLAGHGHAGARRGGRPGLRRGPFHRQHHSSRPADHQDQGRGPRSCPRSSSCACPTRSWSTAIAR